MASFKDKAHREWLVEIDPPAIEKVAKNLDGFRIDQMLAAQGSGLEALFADVVRFVRVLWLLVEDQADALGIKPEQFGKALVGDHLEAAAVAYLQAFADFCPSHQRKIVRALVAKSAEVTTRETELALKKIAALGATGATSSDSATNSPASSESTPAPGAG